MSPYTYSALREMIAHIIRTDNPGIDVDQYQIHVDKYFTDQETTELLKEGKLENPIAPRHIKPDDQIFQIEAHIIDRPEIKTAFNLMVSRRGGKTILGRREGLVWTSKGDKYTPKPNV